MASYPKGTIIKVLQKSNNRCFYCGESFENVKYEIDHFLPFSKHRNGTTANLVAACMPCNRIKSDYDIEGFRDILQSKYGKRVIFFFEHYGITTTPNGIFYTNTLNTKTFNHG